MTHKIETSKTNDQPISMSETGSRKTAHYAALKADIKALYPNEDFTDKELNDMTNRLIHFFVIGVKNALKTKNETENRKG